MRPYFQQQLSLTTYFGRKKQVWPSTCSREYYISFEDALWDLLPRYGVQKGSTLLLPDFYCNDVLDNIRAHGYNVVLYRLDKQLLPDMQSFTTLIAECKPSVVIDFFVAGMASERSKELQKQLNPNTLYIYDFVHVLVSPVVTELLTRPNTLILTSTRKVSPYFGSLAIYNDHILASANKVPVGYTTVAILKWLMYLLLLRISVVTLITYFAFLADSVLDSHDNLIGDAVNAAPLPKFFLNIHDHLNPEKVKGIRLAQYESYWKELQNFPQVLMLDRSKEFAPELRGFPILIDNKYREKFLKECKKLGYFAWTMFEDSTWKNDKNLVLLPMGGDFTLKDIQNISRIVLKALTTAVQYDTITA